jgi:hypothetical protein
MKLKKFENDNCHKLNEALYFALFGVYVWLYFPYLESGKVAIFLYASTACFQISTSICSCPLLRFKNLKKIEEVANHYGYFPNKFQSVENLIFGNAAKIGFLYKLLSRVSKRLVSTVFSFGYSCYYLSTVWNLIVLLRIIIKKLLSFLIVTFRRG